jgi:hypothetical protein
VPESLPAIRGYLPRDLSKGLNSLWLGRGRLVPIGRRNRAVGCMTACAGIASMVKTKHSRLPPKGNLGFHAEWLRDEPCDATTTCLGKPGVWCQLLPGDGEHEIRGSLQHSLQRRLARYFESSLTFALY